MIPDTRNRGGVVTLGVKRATQVNLSFLYNKGFSKLENLTVADASNTGFLRML